MNHLNWYCILRQKNNKMKCILISNFHPCLGSFLPCIIDSVCFFFFGYRELHQWLEGKSPFYGRQEQLVTILLIHPTQKGHTFPTFFLGYSETCHHEWIWIWIWKQTQVLIQTLKKNGKPLEFMIITSSCIEFYYWNYTSTLQWSCSCKKEFRIECMKTVPNWGICTLFLKILIHIRLHSPMWRKYSSQAL